MPAEWIRHKEGPVETGIVQVSTEAANVLARLQPLGTILSFRLDWQRNTEWRNRRLRWELICCEAELLVKDARQLGQSLPAYSYNHAFPQTLEFSLSLTQVEELENLRNGGDVRFNIRATMLMQLHADVNIQRSGIESPISTVVMGLYPFSVNLYVDIPKSRYEESLLPRMGLNSLASLTITFPPGTREMFSTALYELQRAETTLRTASTEEHFESVVLQCRNTIDALLNQFQLDLPPRADGRPDASFSKRVDALSDQYLKAALSNSQAVSVCNILKGLWVPFSGATKPGQAHHSRAFATFALSQATSVVKLISELLWEKQRGKEA